MGDSCKSRRIPQLHRWVRRIPWSHRRNYDFRCGYSFLFLTLAQAALVLVRAPWTDRRSVAVQAERPLPVYQWRGMFTYLLLTVI